MFWRSLAATVLAILAALPLQAAAYPTQVVRQSGRVDALAWGQQAWVTVVSSRMLLGGDRLRTGEKSSARCRLWEGTVLVVGARTELSIEQLAVAASGRQGKVQARVERGSVWARLASGGGSSVRVTTPNAVLAARGTEWVTEYAPAGEAPAEDSLLGTRPGETRAAILESSVQVEAQASGQKALAPQGSTVLITPEGDIQLNAFPFPRLPLLPPDDSPGVERSTLTDGTGDAGGSNAELLNPHGPGSGGSPSGGSEGSGPDTGSSAPPDSTPPADITPPSPAPVSPPPDYPGGPSP
jgi:hypothetical protein